MLCVDIVSLLRISNRFVFSYEVKMVTIGQAHKRLKRSLDPKVYECPICLDILALAHICKCGSSYCYACFRSIAMTAGQSRCAMCKIPWQHPTDLTPNLQIDAITLSYAESNDDASLAASLRRRVERNAELKRNDVRTGRFCGGLGLSHTSSSSKADLPAPSTKIIVPRLVEQLEFHCATPPRPASEPEVVDLCLEAETQPIDTRGGIHPIPEDVDCIDVSQDESFEDDYNIPPWQPLRDMSVGAATQLQGSCQHCGEGIEKDSIRLAFRLNTKVQRYLHLRCVGPFNAKRRKAQGTPICYLSIRGRQDLSEADRTELRHAVRGKGEGA